MRTGASLRWGGEIATMLDQPRRRYRLGVVLERSCNIARVHRMNLIMLDGASLARRECLYSLHVSYAQCGANRRQALTTRYDHFPRLHSNSIGHMCRAVSHHHRLLACRTALRHHGPARDEMKPVSPVNAMDLCHTVWPCAYAVDVHLGALVWQRQLRGI
ncbi:hypothetical protein DOTSEDRAFT_72406 [Dothistroma septosporum NZE10]|uniref:Uncharacterized protein n=1 Tax=Dothistroma septosporum (strain NZE10 / CBS 128990) TaxID=675120 RepID=M2XKF7_DOTSN|nr:hypothetical protein DOTSEDRAFT_72406 [Dothistroma septosporum NZE10]